MRKLFILISVLALSIIANAAVININTETSDALRSALSGANDGDEIVMAAGTYVESNDGFIAFTAKHVTVKAAEGATVIIQPKVPVTIAEGGCAHFENVKFDVSKLTELADWYEHLIYATDANTSNSMILDGCEIYGFTLNNSLLFCGSTNRLASVTITDCYFHNIKKSCLFIECTEAINISISNSTFADITTEASSYYAGVIDSRATSGSFSVDHCTFYNVQVMNTDYAAIGNKKVTLSGSIVSNCIFAMPTSTDNLRAIRNVETANNCLTYNYMYDSNWGIHSSVTKNDCINNSNPYFVNTNPGNHDFTVASFSPAHNAGTDDETLGDYLRWTSDDSAHPTTMNISAGTDAIKAAVEAAWPGDEIVLATGTYNESARLTLDKNITIKAADEATPIVLPEKDIAISNGANVTLQGIKFDGTNQASVSRLIYVADNEANNLTLEGCEICNTGSNVAVYAGSSAHFAACTINNCYFHNGANSAVYFSKTTQEYNACDDLTITNSTFANYSGFNAPLISFYNRNEATNLPTEDDAKLLVDHCTFYNFTKTAESNNTNGFIDSRSSANVIISNCIMANPIAQASLPEGIFNPKASQTYGGTVTNCLRYNVLEHRTAPTNPVVADPLFMDAANGDFTLKRNYITGEVSPAYGAGTEGSTIGDPRWETTATYPETDFAAPEYVFTAAKAKLSAGTTILETNESAPTHPYIRYTHASPTGNAEWVIKATRACYVQATVNMADNTWTYDTGDSKMYQNHNHIFVVEVRDANEALIGSVKECDYNEDGSSDGVDTYPTVNLPGYIYIPQAGVYTVKLRNPRNNSRCGVGSVTISYMGGDTQTITNTDDFVTDIDDAWFTSNGTRADGKISFSGNAVASEWVRWNVTVANSDYYDITLNSAVESGHVYSVTFYDGETQVARVAESAWHNTTGALALGRRFLPAGDYVLEIKNSVSSNSDAKIVSVGAVAFVAPTIALPNTLPAASAITSELAYEDGGELYFTPSDKRGYILDQWAKWKVSVSTPGLFLFTMNVTSTNEQSYKITILDSENIELDSYTKNPGSGDQTIKHYFDLAAGNYFVMVQNTTNHSDGHMVSMVVSQPEMVTIDEAATDNSAWVSKVGDENTYDVQIIRTIKAGMYNTFCLPFEVSSSQCKDIFGSDVQIRTLDEATIETGDFVLNLNFKNASDIYPGTPVLIQTSRDIVNPVFTGVKFTIAAPSATTKTNANYTGTFVKTSLPADENILFLGANNKLFFPTAEVEILGMRGWFVIHGVSANAIKRARIVENEQIATDIELVNSPDPTAKSQKLMENGQLIIIRDGVRYNVMGARVK